MNSDTTTMMTGNPTGGKFVRTRITTIAPKAITRKSITRGNRSDSRPIAFIPTYER